MVERFLDIALRSITLRLWVTGVIVSLPVAISTAWLGSAYQHVVWNVDFLPAMLGMMLAGWPAVLLGGYLMIYPLERWLIRDRAMRSWLWTLVRIVLYLVVGVPLSLVFLWSMRLGTRSYPAAIESSYFVITGTTMGLFGLLYSLLERVLGEVQRREVRLKNEIQKLRIEIDDAKRHRQVREITETDYFRELQLRARQLRASRVG